MKWKFDLQLHGSSNNAAQQNQAAQQQIQQNTAQAAAQIANWIKQNPFPINMQSGPQAPQQQNMQLGGGQFGGTHGQLINGAPPLMNGQMPFRHPMPPQQGPPSVAPQQPPATPTGPPQQGAVSGASGGPGMMQPGALGGNQQLIQALRNAGLA